ncbi:MAG: excisionase family DNA-binding protein [Pseudomonadota bacterium]
MAKQNRTISVTRAAVLCGVGRTTVGYWIRSGKLRAVRTGRNYTIPVEELIYFLKVSGQRVPEALNQGEGLAPSFRSLQPCWDFFKGNAHGKKCSRCVVRSRHLDACFTARYTDGLACPDPCGTCRYFLTTYHERLQFIHQIDLPAAVFCGMVFWSANEAWSRMGGRQAADFIGMGLEKVVHAESLEMLIADNRKRALGLQEVPRLFNLSLKHADGTKIATATWVFPLTEPAEAFLMIGDTAAAK